MTLEVLLDLDENLLNMDEDDDKDEDEDGDEDDDDDEDDDADCKGGATSGLDGTSLKMPSISQATRQAGGELQWR
jgi:hypothetical protein